MARTPQIHDANIRLALPNGREVNVGRTATADELHSDLTFAQHGEAARQTRFAGLTLSRDGEHARNEIEAPT
jgi:hypothetical protein